MIKRKVQFTIIFLFSAIIFCSNSILAYSQTAPSLTAQTNTFFDKTFLQNIAITILTAVLSFFGGYALAVINKKSEISKRLSYNLDIETGLVNVENNIKERVKVMYEGKVIYNLSHIRIDIENTGDLVVKSEEIRFEFLEKTQILDFYFDPQPEPEMRVEKIVDSSVRAFERKCRIGHIEKAQKLGVRFVVTSDSDIQLKLHPYNENGNVEFVSRSATKKLSQREEVARFLTLLIMYFIIPPAFLLFNPLGEFFAGVIRLIFLSTLLRFVSPFSEAIAELISNLVSFEKKDSQSLSLQGLKVEGDLNIGDITQGIQK